MQMGHATKIEGDVCAMQASEGPAILGQHTMCLVSPVFFFAGALFSEVRSCHGSAGAFLARVHVALFNLCVVGLSQNMSSSSQVDGGVPTFHTLRLLLFHLAASAVRIVFVFAQVSLARTGKACVVEVFKIQWMTRMLSAIWTRNAMTWRSKAMAALLMSPCQRR